MMGGAEEKETRSDRTEKGTSQILANVQVSILAQYARPPSPRCPPCLDTIARPSICLPSQKNPRPPRSQGSFGVERERQKGQVFQLSPIKSGPQTLDSSCFRQTVFRATHAPRLPPPPFLAMPAILCHVFAPPAILPTGVPHSVVRSFLQTGIPLEKETVDRCDEEKRRK